MDIACNRTTTVSALLLLRCSTATAASYVAQALYRVRRELRVAIYTPSSLDECVLRIYGVRVTRYPPIFCRRRRRRRHRRSNG